MRLKSFEEFMNEGLKKQIKKANEEPGQHIVDFGGGEANSKERKEAIKKMLPYLGASAVKKALKKRENK